MKDQPTYDQANKSFEKSVRLLTEQLQYLADHDKVSQRFLSLQNQIISSLVDYQHTAEQLLGEKAAEVHSLSRKLLEALKTSQEVRESLEAICLIHGIADLRGWMAHGRVFLVAEAISHHREGTMQLPKKLMKMIEGMNREDRVILERIIHRTRDNRLQHELEELKKCQIKK